MSDKRHGPIRWARRLTRKRRIGVVLLVTAMTLMVFIVVAVALVLGELLPKSVDPQGRRLLWFTFTIIVMGMVSSAALAISMTTFVVEDFVLDQHQMPSLYWPIYAVKVLIPIQLAVSGLQGIDLILHDLSPTWRIFYTPGARLFQAMVLQGIVISLLWLHIKMLEGRGWSKRKRVALVVSIGLISLAVVLGVFVDSIIN